LLVVDSARLIQPLKNKTHLRRIFPSPREAQSVRVKFSVCQGLGVCLFAFEETESNDVPKTTKNNGNGRYKAYCCSHAKQTRRVHSNRMRAHKLVFKENNTEKTSPPSGMEKAVKWKKGAHTRCNAIPCITISSGKTRHGAPPSLTGF